MEVDRPGFCDVGTIPAERMKAGKPHRVPLSKSALAVLDEADHLRNGSGFPVTGESEQATFNYDLGEAVYPN